MKSESRIEGKGNATPIANIEAVVYEEFGPEQAKMEAEQSERGRLIKFLEWYCENVSGKESTLHYPNRRINLVDRYLIQQK